MPKIAAYTGKSSRKNLFKKWLNLQKEKIYAKIFKTNMGEYKNGSDW